MSSTNDFSHFNRQNCISRPLQGEHTCQPLNRLKRGVYLLCFWILASWLPTICSENTPKPVTWASLLLNHPDQWPEYVRGKDKYTWVLNERGLKRGLSHIGGGERMRSALHRWKQGANLTVVTIGGSITAGQGASEGHNWPQYMQNYLEDQLGERVQVFNGAVGGTRSSYMSMCVNVHVPKTADIVFVEYNVNDHGVVVPQFQNSLRRYYERLLRKLLSYPHRPAVVLMHSYSWHHSDGQPEGSFWLTAERDFQEFALYYDLPALSVKGCCYHLLAQNATGFAHYPYRGTDIQGLKRVSFYWDVVHPDGETGTRVMAELAMYLIDSTMKGLETQPYDAADQGMVDVDLPDPMIPNNHQSINDRCFMGSAFTDIVTRKEGFEWINESKTQRPKYGMVATKPGSILEISIDTRASARIVRDSRKHNNKFAAEADQAEDQTVLVELAYLRSYENMGTADVECVSGCTCDKHIIQGHGEDKTSQLHLSNVQVSQHEQCVMRFTVRNETLSGGNKVKMAAAIVSEEAGKREGVQNNMAVEYVHDISFRAQGGTTSFDVRNHARKYRRSLQQQHKA